MYHCSAKDIAFTDKVGHEGICRFIVDVSRGAYLLYFSLAHHHDGVAQGQRLLLVVGHIDEGDAQPFVHLLQLQLHVLSHLQVECSQWFVKQQYRRHLYKCSCNGYSLLLSSRKCIRFSVKELIYLDYFSRIICTFVHLFFSKFIFSFKVL